MYREPGSVVSEIYACIAAVPDVIPKQTIFRSSHIIMLLNYVPPTSPSMTGPKMRNQYPPGNSREKCATIKKLASMNRVPRIDIPMMRVRP